MKIVTRQGMPLTQPETCTQNRAERNHHCWHGVARGAVDKDKMRCCHCDKPTTNTKLFNPARTHGPYAPMRPVRNEP